MYEFITDPLIFKDQDKLQNKLSIGFSPDLLVITNDGKLIVHEFKSSKNSYESNKNSYQSQLLVYQAIINDLLSQNVNTNGENSKVVFVKTNSTFNPENVGVREIPSTLNAKAHLDKLKQDYNNNISKENEEVLSLFEDGSFEVLQFKPTTETTNQSEIEAKKEKLENAKKQLEGVESRINPNANHSLYNVGDRNHEGNKYIIESLIDERTNIEEKGVTVITKIISPAQVHTNGKMIKAAKVEVGIFDSYEQAEEFVNAQYSKYKAIAEDKIKKANTELQALESKQKTTQEEVGRLNINDWKDFANLTEEERKELKDNASKIIDSFPDNMFYLIHLTNSKDALSSIMVNGLNTGVAIESTTNNAPSKQSLKDSINAIIDGKVAHRGSANLAIIAFPTSILENTSGKINYVEEVSNYIAENHTEYFGKSIPAQYSFAYFTDGVLSLNKQIPLQNTEESKQESLPVVSDNDKIFNKLDKAGKKKVLESIQDLISDNNKFQLKSFINSDGLETILILKDGFYHDIANQKRYSEESLKEFSLIDYNLQKDNLNKVIEKMLEDLDKGVDVNFTTEKTTNSETGLEDYSSFAKNGKSYIYLNSVILSLPEIVNEESAHTIQDTEVSSILDLDFITMEDFAALLNNTSNDKDNFKIENC